MIPKTIHYCWFGPHQKPKDVIRSIESWKRSCPTFEIKEWNESNFPIDIHPFTRKMYAEKRYAFVADYVRLCVLKDEGGIYLDADMLILKDLTPLCEYECVLGEEQRGIISAGMMGATPHHPYIESCKEYYDTEMGSLITIPVALTNVYKNYPHKESIHVYPPKAFYPFDQKDIGKYHGQYLGDDVYGVHLWNYSWGHPLNKFFKKIGVYHFGKRVVELLGIKKVLKKLFRFI